MGILTFHKCMIGFFFTPAPYICLMHGDVIGIIIPLSAKYIHVFENKYGLYFADTNLVEKYCP